jgi:hypothetical protein
MAIKTSTLLPNPEVRRDRLVIVMRPGGALSVGLKAPQIWVRRLPAGLEYDGTAPCREPGRRRRRKALAASPL